MELEKLKQEWKVHSKLRGDHLSISRAGIEKALRERSFSLRKSIQRKMSLDAVFMIIVLGITITLLYLLNLKYWTIGALSVIATGFMLFIHFHFTHRLLNRSYRDESILSQTRHTLRVMKIYTGLYQWIVPILFTAICFTFWKLNIFSTLGISQPDSTLLIQIGSSLLFGILSWILLWVIIRWTFGKSVKHLRELLSNLSEPLP